ncbi:MAG: hydroxymethylbilane synthase [Hyphomonadaceae bacterium]|nr:hydroxymethylbilane synthase [Hyphomonadaceae bacterium]
MGSFGTITLRIGTRASPLALAQAQDAAARLEQLSEGAIRTELVTFTTTGDRLTTERLINAGGKGLFTRELDRALDEGEIHLGVHSLKDVPSRLPDSHEFVAFPERADPREGFLSPHATKLEDLPKGAVLGTASLRREAQTRRARPDLEIVPFRGNVQTRMKKLEAGEAAATYLAMAGLARLGIPEMATPISLEDMLSAPCQGIVACTARMGELPNVALAALQAMTHAPSRQAALAERAFLTTLDGSCRTPIAAHLFHLEGGGARFLGEVLRPDGAETWRSERLLAPGFGDEALQQVGIAAGEEIRSAAGGTLPAFEDDA